MVEATSPVKEPSWITGRLLWRIQNLSKTMKRSILFLPLLWAPPLIAQVELFDGRTPVTAGVISGSDKLPFSDVSASAGSRLKNITVTQFLTDFDLLTGTDFLSPAAIAAAYQGLDADLTTWAGVTPSANGISVVSAANYAAMRALLDLEPGTDFLSVSAIAAAYQPLDADLTSIASLTTTSTGRSLLTMGADPNADRLLFWDDSAGAYTYLTLGTNLSITGTTLNAAGGGGGGTLDPLNFTAASTLTIATGAVTATQTIHVLAAESGTSDTLDSIAGGVEGDVLIVRPDSGDSITLSDGTSGGDNLDLAGQNVLLNSTNESVTLVFNGTNWTILAVSPSLLTVDLTGQQTDTWIIAASDETTALTTGTNKVTFEAPYSATITGIGASLTTAPTGSILIADVNVAAGSVMATDKLDIDVSEKTTRTGATAPVITNTTVTAGDIITVDIDQIGSTIAGAGLKIYITHTH